MRSKARAAIAVLGFTLAAAPAWSGDARAAEARFVGSKKCQACHFAEHKSWSATRMARALDLLKPGAAAEAKTKAGLDPARDYTADPGCLACHATGAGRPGGFASAIETPDLGGVGCEACHGAGSEYLKDGKMTLANRSYKRADLVAAGLLRQDRETCAALCHNEKSPTHRPFDFETGVRTQVHAVAPLKFPHE